MSKEEDFSLLRHFALNLVESAEKKTSVKRKQKKAWWGEEFLLKILLNDGNYLSQSYSKETTKSQNNE